MAESERDFLMSLDLVALYKDADQDSSSFSWNPVKGAEVSGSQPLKFLPSVYETDPNAYWSYNLFRIVSAESNLFDPTV